MNHFLNIIFINIDTIYLSTIIGFYKIAIVLIVKVLSKIKIANKGFI